MLGYIVRRLVAAVIVLFLISLFTFTLFFKGPSNPAEALCYDRGRCTPQKLQAMEHSMGLDKGVWSNYSAFLGGLVHDRTISYGSSYDCSAPCLGISFHSRTEISKDLVKYYPATFSLAIGGGALYLLIGVPIGILAARYRGSFFDRFSVGLSQVVASVPYPVLAVLAFIYLTLQYNVFPSTGYHPFLHNPLTWAGGLLLPWVILGISGSPTYARYARGQMVETLSEDYIRTARAKGLGSRPVLFKHALRAVMVPIITLFGLDFATLLSGTIFTEAIFQINGIGQWTLQSLKAPTDFPIINATVLIFAVLIILGNLLVDLIYAVLDPRVRLV